MQDKPRHIVCSAVEIGSNALLTAFVWRHGECYVIILCWACVVRRLYSTKRAAVLSRFFNMEWLYRPQTSVVGGGTTNQSEAGDHGVMHVGTCRWQWRGGWGAVSELWLRGDWYGGIADELATRLLTYLLPSSGKLQVAAPESSSR